MFISLYSMKIDGEPAVDEDKEEEVQDIILAVKANNPSIQDISDKEGVIFGELPPNKATQ